MTRKLVALAVAASLGGAGSAAAQTTATGTATMTMGTVLSISVTNTSPSFSPTLSDVNAGLLVAGTTSMVTTKGNVTHGVTVLADAANFTAPVGRTKPASDLQLSVRPFGGAFGSYTGLSSVTPTNIVTGRAPGDYSSQTPEVQYRLLLSFEDIPGTYTLGLTYTIAAS